MSMDETLVGNMLIVAAVVAGFLVAVVVGVQVMRRIIGRRDTGIDGE